MIKKKCLPIFLSVMLVAVCLTGCRNSPALEDVVYTKEALEVDQTHEVAEADSTAETGSAPDERLAENQNDQKEELTDGNGQGQQNDEPQKSGKDTTSQSAQQASVKGGLSAGEDNGGEVTGNGNAVSDSNVDASTGIGGTSKGGTGESGDSDKQGDNRIQTDTSGTNPVNAVDSEQDNTEMSGNPDENINPGNEPNDGESNENQPQNSYENTPEIPKKTVTDGNGNQQMIPEDVFRVTAVGAAASAVEMIGGSGRLIASSESFTLNAVSAAVCSDVAAGMVQTWWSEDGGSPISEENFVKLLEEKPQVCFEINGQETFTSDQIARLSENGIGYLSLPEFNSTSNIKAATIIIAKTLDVHEPDGQSAIRIADAYCDWVDNSMNNVMHLAPSESYATLYLNDWNDDLEFYRYFNPGDEGWAVKDIVSFPGYESGTGRGAAIAWSHQTVMNHPYGEFLQAANIVDAMNDNFRGSDEDAAFKDFIVFPHAYNFGIPIFSTDQYNCQNLTNYYSDEKVYRDTFHDGISQVYIAGTKKTYLGDVLYPAIIVEREEIGNKIMSSSLWQPYSHMELLNMRVDSSQPTNNFGYETMFDYSIYLAPNGFENWLYGGVDSPLLGYWLSDRITGTIRGTGILKETVTEFYSQFFGVDISDELYNYIVH